MSCASPVLLYSSEQQAAIAAALRCGLSIVTGGPGTGKTTVTHGIVRAWQQRHQTTPERIVLCSPTGKAAKRLADAVGLPAATIHRTLLWAPGTTGHFVHNAGNPLDAELVLVDEASMIDLPLMAALLSAVPAGAHAVLIGDSDQLPPVGPGQPFADLIGSGRVPVTALRHIYRQQAGSAILDAAAAVREGRVPVAPPGQSEYVQLSFAAAAGFDDDTGEPATRHGAPETKRRIADRALEAVAALRDRVGIALQEIQVLTPEKRGECGSLELNRRLRGLLNPCPPAEIEVAPAHADEPALVLGVGDRVIQSRNNYTLGVFNGEVGTVVGAGRVTVTEGEGRARRKAVREGVAVRFEDSGQSRVVGYERADAMELQHAWALTVHRCQGSEFEAAVFALPWSYLLCTRSLVYTGITRGRRHVVLLAEEGALARAARSTGLQRSTALAERIRAAG